MDDEGRAAPELIRALLAQNRRVFLLEQGFSVANMSYAGTGEPRCLEYQMVIKSRLENSARGLAEALGKSTKILDFRMTPTGD